MASNPAPSDSEAAAYYEAHAESSARRPTCTCATSSSRAKRTRRRCRRLLAKAKGADWAKLVTTWSQDTLTKTNAGDLGTVTSDGGFVALGAQPALAESAMALGTGGIGGPFKTNKGWHVLKVDSYQADAVRPLDQVRSFIVRQLAQQRSTSFYQELLGRAKANSKVVTDSAAMRSYMSTRKSAREMFQDAQQAGAPQARIDAYRRLVAEWPARRHHAAGRVHGRIHLFRGAEGLRFRGEGFPRTPRSTPSRNSRPPRSWMVDHMRTEEAPSFSPGEADSSAPAAAPGKGPKK